MTNEEKISRLKFIKDYYDASKEEYYQHFDDVFGMSETIQSLCDELMDIYKSDERQKT